MHIDTRTVDLDVCSHATAAPADGGGLRATTPKTDTTAYLIVHAESTGRDERHARTAETPLQRLRALYSGGPSHDQRAPLALTLADRNGREVLSLADADPVLGVALMPGTYHLTATLGEVRRGYTVSLPAGSRFDLYLRFTTPGHERSASPVAVRSAH